MKNNIGLTHYYQMLHYAKSAEEQGYYYGYKAHFEKRHAHIIKFLEEAIEKLESKQKTKETQ